jgi:uncharacterized protein DUF5681
MADRTKKGRFAPGVSGNPGGRPKLPAEMKEMFQAKAPEAFEVLCRHLNSNDARVSVIAAREILDRAYGRPVQQHQLDMEERIKLIAVVPEKSATTEDWLKAVGEQRVIEHRSTDLEGTE